MKKNKKENKYGAIIVFFKELSLKKTNGKDGYISSAHNKGYNIYYGAEYEKKLQNLAYYILDKNVKDTHQLEAVKDEIHNWLSTALYDDYFFEITDVKKSLFENRKIKSIEDFSFVFVRDVINRLNEKIIERYLLFPVKNFTNHNFLLENIVFLKKNKDNHDIIKKAFTAAEKDLILLENLFNDTMNQSVFKDYHDFLLITTKSNYSFKKDSEKTIKKFLTVSLSLFEDKPSSINKAYARPNLTYIYHEQNKNRGQLGMMHYGIFDSDIIPSLLLNKNQYIFNEVKVKEWYQKFNELNDNEKNKIDNFIYTLNSAFNRNKYDRYNDICRAVDSLFGINRKVEKTINGNLRNIVKKYDGDGLFLKKIELLWKLRNEMVHGEESEIKNSKTYLKYKMNYNTCPENDYLDLAFFCLKNAPLYFKNEDYLDFKENKKNKLFNLFIRFFSTFLKKRVEI